MNAKQLIATVAMFAATSAAFAQSSEYATPHENFVSSKTRAEVKAELQQAYAEGALAQHDGQDIVIVAGKRSRAEVRAEAIQSASNQRNGNANGSYFGG